MSWNLASWLRIQEEAVCRAQMRWTGGSEEAWRVLAGGPWRDPETLGGGNMVWTSQSIVATLLCITTACVRVFLAVWVCRAGEDFPLYRVANGLQRVCSNDCHCRCIDLPSMVVWRQGELGDVANHGPGDQSYLNMAARLPFHDENNGPSGA
ncbi:predicted protein [Plenodomus lingam JN3]|uniref:Predicted protein n=1 Tax=Leptosphaeria maculans (strain JN3 / isolate v23.1.3 / race Av1-4-5-6-7-8) TaxID=985895 RepID=E4ZMV3_LEPMJ|nr:predicted protein [Plenodomus lingam JN3]CBX92556.1 predicted protein [Plenodomus lingam JN3]